MNQKQFPDEVLTKLKSSNFKIDNILKQLDENKHNITTLDKAIVILNKKLLKLFVGVIILGILSVCGFLYFSLRLQP